MSVQQSQEPAPRTVSQPAQQQQGQQQPADPQSTATTPATKPQIRDWASI